jgi:hypothetical protein
MVDFTQDKPGLPTVEAAEDEESELAHEPFKNLQQKVKRGTLSKPGTNCCVRQCAARHLGKVSKAPHPGDCSVPVKPAPMLGPTIQNGNSATPARTTSSHKIHVTADRTSLAVKIQQYKSFYSFLS